jgi:hypothetical protein
VEASPYGPRLNARVAPLGSAFPLRYSQTQALPDHLLGVEISCRTSARIRADLEVLALVEKGGATPREVADSLGVFDDHRLG